MGSCHVLAGGRCCPSPAAGHTHCLWALESGSSALFSWGGAGRSAIPQEKQSNIRAHSEPRSTQAVQPSTRCCKTDRVWPGPCWELLGPPAHCCLTDGRSVCLARPSRGGSRPAESPLRPRSASPGLCCWPVAGTSVGRLARTAAWGVWPGLPQSTVAMRGRGWERGKERAS